MGSWKIMDRAVTDFPQPLSPTRPSTSPFAISKLTPSTAWTSPRVVRNSVLRPRTVSSGSILSPPEPWIEDVAEAVAEEVHAHREDQEDEAREDDGPGVRREVAVADHDQVPEFRGVRGQPRQADEVQGREDLGHRAEVQGDLDEHGRQGVRQDVAHH